MEKNSYAYIAIVAIVAVVAMVVMFSGNGVVQKEVEGNDANVGGDAIRSSPQVSSKIHTDDGEILEPHKCSSNADCTGTYCQDGPESGMTPACVGGNCVCNSGTEEEYIPYFYS